MSWKIGNITPTHKKGSRTGVGNGITYSWPFDGSYDENKLFCDAQHGFVPGRSYMSQLLVVIEMWTEMLDSVTQLMPSVLISAKVWHCTTPQIVEQIERRDTYDWISAFLNGHIHQAVVNSSLSSWLEVLSDISQGSVLGPILFILFINDPPHMVWSTAHIFAGDTKVYRKAFTDQTVSNCKQTLQDCRL